MFLRGRARAREPIEFDGPRESNAYWTNVQITSCGSVGARRNRFARRLLRSVKQSSELFVRAAAFAARVSLAANGEQQRRPGGFESRLESKPSLVRFRRTSSIPLSRSRLYLAVTFRFALRATSRTIFWLQ